MVSSGLLRRVALVRTDVSEEPGATTHKTPFLAVSCHPVEVGDRFLRKVGHTVSHPRGRRSSALEEVRYILSLFLYNFKATCTRYDGIEELCSVNVVFLNETQKEKERSRQKRALTVQLSRSDNTPILFLCRISA
jgi:hypothetical protein